MKTLLRLSGLVDRLNERVGGAVSWLCLAMVLLGSWNAVARYLGRSVGFDLSSNSFIEAQWYMFSLVFLLGAGFTLQQNAHVRVDVFYARLGIRGKAWIDLLGGLLFLLPFSVAAVVLSWPSVRNSWAVLEASNDPGGLPRYPLKTVLPIAFALLILQGLAQIVRSVHTLRGGDGDTPPPSPSPSPSPSPRAENPQDSPRNPKGSPDA